MNINKAGLAEMLQQKVGLSKADSEKAMEAVVGTITETLKGGGQVSIAGLGIFEAKERAARKARNPRTGESVDVPAMRVPKFRAGKALKDAVK